MINQQIEKLLILQDRDQVVRRLLGLLESVPKQIEVHQNEITAEKDALQDSRSKLQALEVQRNDLDMQVGSAEEQINKYKNQQLQVKKNEEFQALTHEIDGLKAKISEWEEEEIALMLEIDTEGEVFAKREGVFDDNVAKIQAQIDALEARSKELELELQGAKADFESAKAEVDSSLYTTYDRLASRMKLPVVVPIEQQTCRGCHMKVSTDNSVQAAKGESLTTCDNCGRVIYSAS